MPPTKGYQTSEFWVTLMGAAVGLFLIAFGAIKDKDTAMYVGGTLFVAAGGAYAISRGNAKAAPTTQVQTQNTTAPTPCPTH